MAISLDELQPQLRDTMTEVLQSLMSFGVEMRPYFGLRTPKEQAILWRQSRAREEIAAAVARLRQGGAPFLADTLEDVGPHNGEHVTNALPGLSWHQWGEAVDCFWAVNGRAEWSPTKIIDGINGYREYARAVKAAGLTAGGLWPSFKDWPHAQLRRDGSPASAGMTLAEIDARMRELYG